MTNIDERIEEVLMAHSCDIDDLEFDEPKEKLKQLIRDVLEEVKPKSREEYRPGKTTDGQMMQVHGWNRAIKVIESKQKELGL